MSSDATLRLKGVESLRMIVIILHVATWISYALDLNIVSCSSFLHLILFYEYAFGPRPSWSHKSCRKLHRRSTISHYGAKSFNSLGVLILNRLVWYFTDSKIFKYEMSIAMGDHFHPSFGRSFSSIDLSMKIS